MDIKQLKQRMRTGHKLTIKKYVQNLVNIYHDNWCYIILEELQRQVSKETFKKFKFLVSQELNILKRVVNDLSVVYKEPATRRAVIKGQAINEESGEMSDEVQDIDLYEEVLKDTNKDEALQAINKFTNLTNNTMLKVTYRNGKLDYDVFLFNNIEIYTNPEDWKEIVAIKYYNGLQVDEDTGGLGNYSGLGYDYPAYMPTMKYDTSTQGVAAAPIQDYYSSVVWVKKDMPNDGIIENGKEGDWLKGGTIYYCEPYGDYEDVTKEEDVPYLDEDGEPVMPFVLYNRIYPIDQLLNFTEGNDIRDLTVNVAILLIYLNSVEKYQSFKQLVFNTDDPDSIPSEIKLGPTDVIINPTKEGGGSVEVLDLQADITNKYNLIKERIVNVLTGYGISPQNFTMSASPTSGFALKISNIGKLEARESQLPLYRKREKELFDIERIVWNEHNPNKKIPLDAELEIDFAEMEFPKSPQEQNQQDEFNLTHNIITEIDIMRRINPDLTEDQAKEKWNENKAFNDAQKEEIELKPIQQPGQRPPVTNGNRR